MGKDVRSIEVRNHRPTRTLLLTVGKGLLFHLIVLCMLYAGSLLQTGAVLAATYETPNFIVHAKSAELARKAGDTAEACRQELALLWLGVPLQPWSAKCPIEIKAGRNLGAGGETSFTFSDGEVFDWKMRVQGSEERILDSVIPHEVSHTILASWFRRPVPRWIDEGAATSVESQSERDNYRHMLVDFLQTSKGIPFNSMVSQREYPNDQMPFYAQGFSVCEYLIKVGGHRRLIEFARTGMASGNWSEAVKLCYGYENLGDLQIQWQDWVSQWFHARMPQELPDVVQLASYTAPVDLNQPPFGPNPVIRGQATGENGWNHDHDSLAVAPVSRVPAPGRLIPNLPIPSVPAPEAVSPENTIPGNLFATGVGTTVPENSEFAPLARALPAEVSDAPLRYQGSYGQGIE